jgi:hypothetical protein
MEVFRERKLRRARRQAVTLARAIRAGRARAKATPRPPQVDGEALRDLLEQAAAEARLVEVAANRRPWMATGLRIGVGEEVTWLAWGRAYLIKPLAIGVKPSLGLLGRVGDGRPQESARDSLTFTADRDGPLELAGRLPGELQEDGSIATDRVPYRAMRGGFGAVVARWPAGSDVRAALDALAPRDPSGLCAAEAARLAQPQRPPSGWEHHPLTGREEVYAASTDGLVADCRDSVSLIRRPAAAPLTPTLQLRWSWRLDELPSTLPEDTPLTHDYLSVALEFDDGQDLTWQWSCDLPEGFAYRCPLEHWRHRETHVVVRRGSVDLGRWVEDERPVLADHQAAIGGPAPASVVRAWLIAVSFNQGGTGRGEFARIELVDGDHVVRVL